MSKAIGLIEFSSIAKGIEACDVMLKSSQTEIIRAATVCPGKYIVVISGNTSDIQTAIQKGKNSALKYVVDTLIIPNAEQGLINAMQGKEKHSTNGAIGIIEFYSISSAIQAADTATKTTNVTLLEI
ncbi:MAG: BMC domain-containing protein, partial [Oscillospiraceae bacterium]